MPSASKPCATILLGAGCERCGSAAGAEVRGMHPSHLMHLFRDKPPRLEGKRGSYARDSSGRDTGGVAELGAGQTVDRRNTAAVKSVEYLEIHLEYATQAQRNPLGSLSRH